MKEIKNKKTDVSVYKNEAFDNGFYEYFKIKKKNKISDILNNNPNFAGIFDISKIPLKN